MAYFLGSQSQCAKPFSPALTVDLWTSARVLTCSAMKSRVLVLKGELQQTQKGSMKVDDYLNKLKSISEQLALTRALVTTHDLILQTLHGLDVDYNVVVVNLFQVLGQRSLTWIASYLPETKQLKEGIKRYGYHIEDPLLFIMNLRIKEVFEILAQSSSEVATSEIGSSKQ
ncbi:glutamate receptor [Senna tora]|uniref:Glutamate receptor n=1 Tax=Senna tora TaxID=362788 RepID=A0A834T2Z6_9FABA|nr:glutamate receptor [Senna tora]